MCGHVGCAGDLNAGHEKLMRTLLILDSLRGEHSTGVAAVSKWDGHVKVAKQVGDPFQLFEHKSYDKAFSGLQRAIIGHNRYATVGVINRTNAHPFENASVVGAHNGTLTTKYLLADANNFKVDSENIYHHIDKFGLNDALKYMDGAWALVWWDKDTEEMNFLRNEERPLYLTRSEDGKVIFWASEPWMLSVALGKHYMKHGEISMLPPNALHTVSVDNKGVLGKVFVKNAPSTYVAPQHRVTQQTSIFNEPPASNVVQHSSTRSTPAVVPPANPVGNKVLTLPGKKEDTAAATPKKQQASNVESYDRSYLSAKGVLYETLNASKDDYKAPYIALFDANRPYIDIRLYAPAGDPVWDMIGCDITADVQSFQPGGTPGKGVYRVRPDSIKIVVPMEPEAEEAERIMGPTGKFLTEEEFNRRYPTCSWCTEALSFKDANKFSTSLECFCPGCATNKDVLEAVNF